MTHEAADKAFREAYPLGIPAETGVLGLDIWRKAWQACDAQRADRLREVRLEAAEEMRKRCLNACLPESNIVTTDAIKAIIFGSDSRWLERKLLMARLDGQILEHDIKCEQCSVDGGVGGTMDFPYACGRRKTLVAERALAEAGGSL